MKEGGGRENYDAARRSRDAASVMFGETAIDYYYELKMPMQDAVVLELSLACGAATATSASSCATDEVLGIAGVIDQRRAARTLAGFRPHTAGT